MVILQDDEKVTSASIVGNVKYLSILGLWPKTSDSTLKSQITNLLFGLGYFIQCSGFLSILLASFLNSTNIQENINTAYLATVVFNCLFKQAYVRYKTNEFQELVASMDTLFIKATYPLKQIKKEIIHGGNHATSMLLRLVTGPCILAGFSVLLTPLTANLDHTNGRPLPYDAWIPCNKTETPCYEVAYCFLSINAILLPFYTSSTDLLIVSLIIQTFKQFDILKILFKNIREIAREEIESEYKDEKHLTLIANGSSFLQSSGNEVEHEREVQVMHHVLLRAIHDHINLLSFAERLKILASSFLIIQMAVDVVVLCILTVQFTLFDSYLSFQFISAFSVYIAALSILGLICWCGGELADKSEAVGSAAFESDWYITDTKFKRSLKIVMMRTQYPCKITIAKIMDFNLISFTRVLRASYSFFTVLQETAVAHPHHETNYHPHYETN